MVLIITANTSWYLYNFRYNTIKSLLKDGYEVIALSPKDTYSEKLEEIGCQWVDISIDQNGVNPVKDFLTFISFFCSYRKLKPKIILNFTPKNNIYSTLAASILGVSCINNISGLGKMFTENTISSRVAKLLYKYTQFRAKKVFFQNEEDRRIFLDLGFVDANKTERLNGSGVDLERFKMEAREDDGVVRFLLMARLLTQKGIYIYAEAAKEVKSKLFDKVEFKLLGDLDHNNPNSISKSSLDGWVNEGSINYLGVSDDVVYEISTSDCIVLPSFYREGVPKSLLEALGSGKPIITTNNVGCKDTVEEGVNGFLCEPKDVKSLVDNIFRFISLSKMEKCKMAHQSRKLAENKFDEKLIISKYLNAINEILMVD